MQRMKMRGQMGRWAVGLLIAAILLPEGRALAAAYEVYDLGTPTGLPNSYATSINDSGIVTVNSIDQGEGASLYTATGSTPVTLSGNGDVVQQVNNSGLAVGYFTDVSGNQEAAYVDPVSQSQSMSRSFIAINSGDQSFATAASNSISLGTSTIVGANYVDTQPSNTQNSYHFIATEWTGTGTPSAASAALIPSTSTLFDGTQSSQANAINDSGQIVGFALDSSGNQRAFLRASDGAFSDITPTSDLSGAANAINSAGAAVGDAFDSDGNQLGFIYTTATGSKLLNGFGGDATFSGAESINTADQIVGSAQLADGSNTVAVIYNSLGDPLDLNGMIPSSSGWVLNDASSINNSGDIIGTGLFDGNQDAFLLVPTSSVPEPTTAVIFVVSTMGLLRRHRR